MYYSDGVLGNLGSGVFLVCWFCFFFFELKDVRIEVQTAVSQRQGKRNREIKYVNTSSVTSIESHEEVRKVNDEE